MAQRPEKIDTRLVYLDPFLMDRVRINMGLSRKALAKKIKMSINTLLDAFDGRGLQPFNTRRLADALGCR